MQGAGAILLARYPRVAQGAQLAEPPLARARFEPRPGAGRHSRHGVTLIVPSSAELKSLPALDPAPSVSQYVHCRPSKVKR